MPPDLPRPEYPRPQFVRARWASLNGEWEFAFDDADAGLRERWWDGRCLPADPGRIVVPFPYQSAHSGIGDTAVHEVVCTPGNQSPSQGPPAIQLGSVGVRPRTRHSFVRAPVTRCRRGSRAAEACCLAMGSRRATPAGSGYRRRSRAGERRLRPGRGAFPGGVEVTAVAPSPAAAARGR
jgi:hypothetical protein